jgi:hypothetical protein
MLCIMDVRPNIAELEQRLAAEGESVASLCRIAELNQSTWVRWKQGNPAQIKTWKRVTRAAVKLLGEASADTAQQDAA